ncbi:hypothetical protein [Methylobacterium oryzisoli]|uniref:hypothetical protein n=1 Tax=Methylobacterium oryzisoli TaxID=3385502 RepID=UPI0038920F05
MTALAILVEPEVVLIASDGAVLEPQTFKLTQAASRIVLCPEWSCVLASRSQGWPAEVVRRQAQLANVTSFDELIARSDELVRIAADAYCQTSPSHSADFSVFLAGWSDAQQRMALYVVSTLRASEQLRSDDAYKAAPLPNLVLVPSPTGRAAALVGLQVYRGQEQFSLGDPIQYLQRVIAAARFSGRGTPAEPCTVGCFIQVTQLQRDYAHTMITHRWNDRIGEPMQPFREPTVPAFMVRRGG